MLEIGQVLHLRIVLNIKGLISKTKHPYIIYNIDTENRIVEVIQLDSQEGKEKHLRHPANHPIAIDGPWETVISKSSYARCDCKYTLELFDDLCKARKTTDKLSEKKLKALIEHYELIQHKWDKVNKENVVYQCKEVLLELNEELR